MKRDLTPFAAKTACTAVLLAILFTGITLEAMAEGSRNFYPSGAQGRRAYLQSRYQTRQPATFNPFPNRGTHRVWVNPGEIIYVGSSLQGYSYTYPTTPATTVTGSIILRTPNGNSYTSGTSTTSGRINNRTEELNGPDRGTINNGYAPYTRTVGALEGGIWEIDFISLEPDATVYSNNGTNLNQHTGTGGDRLFDNDFQANYSWTGTGLTGQPIANNSSALILAWDVSVSSAATPETLITGRVFFTNITLTLPNNYPPNGGFYGKAYILTKEGYSYLLDNNNLNGASWSLFSNNKGITSGAA